MNHNQFDLLKTRRFLPLFITQFFGAFNDNAFKLAMLTLISYHLATSQSDSEYYQALAAGIFILPFFLFSATAGQMADKYDKAKIAFGVKILEVVLMIVGGIGLYFGNIQLLMVTLFGLGTHSTFFGPLKYSILPQHLQEYELIGANGLIEASTFLAILLGTVLGTLSIGSDSQTVVWAIALTVVCALIGLTSSYFILPAKSDNEQLKINFNVFTATWNIVKEARKSSMIFLLILAISWFWCVGSVLLTKLPDYTHYVLHADTKVFALFLALFSIGIASGSLAVNRLLKGVISPTFVPFGILGLSIFAFDLYFASPTHAIDGALFGLGEFFQQPRSLRICIDFFLLAICGGIFIVPLYAMLQFNSEESVRSRIIAANNIINALFMVAASVFIGVFAEAGFTIPHVFLILAIINAVVAVYVCKLLPQALIKSFIKWLLQWVYRVEVKGYEYYTQHKGGAVIIANHTSYLDIVLLAAFLPDNFMVAVNTDIAKRWWVKPWLNLVESFPIDSTKPMAIKSIIKEVRKGKKCVIFPEGRLTITGTLMKVYEGPGLISERAGVKLIPIRIDGAMYTPFSRIKHKVRIKWFPKISLTIYPPRDVTVNAKLSIRAKRQQISMHMYQLMTEMLFESMNYRNKSILSALREAKKIHGSHKKIIEDVARQEKSYQALLNHSYTLSQCLKQTTKKGERVGVWLTNSNQCVSTFLALLAAKRVPAFFDESQNSSMILSALKCANASTLITTREMTADPSTQQVVATELKEHGIKLLYLEELIPNALQKTVGFLKAHGLNFSGTKKRAQREALVSFCFDDNGKASMVSLTHQNLIANCYQIISKVDFNKYDVLFNPVPMTTVSHLIMGVVLPLVAGVKVFFYPHVKHKRIIAEMVYDTNASLLIGDEALLSRLTEVAHPYDFYSLRYIFALGDPLSEDTMRAWSDNFGTRLFQTYSNNHTATLVAMNSPMQYQRGTLGSLLPSIEIKQQKTLWVSGPNVPGEWVNTGDKIAIDDYGYLSNSRVRLAHQKKVG